MHSAFLAPGVGAGIAGVLSAGGFADFAVVAHGIGRASTHIFGPTPTKQRLLATPAWEERARPGEGPFASAHSGSILVSGNDFSLLLAQERLFVQSAAMVKRSQICAFSEAVAREFRPRKIVLFGSYAYGKPTEDSDVDLLVIMRRTRDRGERMSVRIRQAIPRDFPLDLLVRTPADVAKRLRWGDPFISELLKNGEVLYEAGDA